jgi:hypothetical protein
MEPLDKVDHYACPSPTFKVTGGHFVPVCHPFVSCEHSILRMAKATQIKYVDTPYEDLVQVQSCLTVAYFQCQW